MKAAIFEMPGLENLKVVDNAEKPKNDDHNILIKVKMAGINPIDYFVVSGSLPKIEPIPHIPGAESCGIVEEVGSHVNEARIMKGDRVVVHNKVFDGTCDMCLNGLDMICRNGGLIGAITNGGFAEYISVPETNVFKIPDNLDWDLAASLPVTSLTPYHALKEASLKINEYLLVFGASGNTGMIAVQIGKKIGARVIAISRDSWIKSEFGANYIISDYDKVVEQVKEITQGKMADVVLNSLGIGTWDSSFASVGINGRWVAFGGLTGADVKLNVQSLYSKQIKLIGSTGGTRKEMQELIDISPELKVRVWKKFDLENVKEALQALFAKERDGRILLTIS
ncbi:MAG TPA: alcohol dehydrogenase catalytic domain-containing protein [Nitrososphaeraceae archaeon]|nr:alcohol dehydrogenase catalytic domain-containing protein [Nitrososphaeraceae archaeon]HJY11053.1 alcohol dehydrogenase catalytic domain-containing protein [Nitrososphaeraceae archaeon]HJY15316.1 alcohol dehydrogenase catalytic domain-containing protein [Nitrososphaeraceae archaeon]